MRSLSHFENFARSVALRRLVSCPRTTHSLTHVIMSNATTLQDMRTARFLHSLPTSTRSPLPVHMQFP